MLALYTSSAPNAFQCYIQLSQSLRGSPYVQSWLPLNCQSVPSLDRSKVRIRNRGIDLDGAVEGPGGGIGPAENDSEAGEEAVALPVSQLNSSKEIVVREGNSHQGLAASALEQLGVVAGSGLLGDGEALKGVSLHGAADGSHGAKERELAALDGASSEAGDDGRHGEG